MVSFLRRPNRFYDYDKDLTWAFGGEYFYVGREQKVKDMTGTKKMREVHFGNHMTYGSLPDGIMSRLYNRFVVTIKPDKDSDGEPIVRLFVISRGGGATVA